MKFNSDKSFFAAMRAGNGHPLVIAGPCSAESEEQVLQTAQALQEQQVHLFRAGIWKPRTRPGSFEGVGSAGLAWLALVKQELGMQVTTEVATARHVEEALKHGIDVLWIGARTTVNPFAVQEIADALQGVNVPVMVKNPVNPDLALWIGAIERLYHAGITDLAAIHRGFSSYQKTKYRNVPVWQIPIELKARYQDMPLLVDPSHIGGRRELIFPVSQKALDLGYDG
ncbi:MAG: 3-deoxy-7-phosphoheptulonate synthase, partial [Pontibacter sp.]|nr:3-deoxy-7-phosphoheptulonate synthase [Pontibacter sp.]